MRPMSPCVIDKQLMWVALNLSWRPDLTRRILWPYPPKEVNTRPEPVPELWFARRTPPPPGLEVPPWPPFPHLLHQHPVLRSLGLSACRGLQAPWETPSRLSVSGLSHSPEASGPARRPNGCTSSSLAEQCPLVLVWTPCVCAGPPLTDTWSCGHGCCGCSWGDADMWTPGWVCVAVQGLPRPDSVPNGIVSVSKGLRLTPNQTLRHLLFTEAVVYTPADLEPQTLRPPQPGPAPGGSQNWGHRGESRATAVSRGHWRKSIVCEVNPRPPT